MPLPTPRRVAAHGGGSARARIGALLFGLAFLLGAAEARAAAVCSNTPGANDWIRCTQTGTADIDIDLANPAISTTGPGDEGIWAEHTGTGNIDIDVTGGSIAAADSYGVRARHEAAGAIDIDLTNVDVSTQGQLDFGVSVQHLGTSGTGIDIDVTGGSVATAGSSAYGINATVNDSTGVAVGAAISIDTKNTRVSTMGDTSYGVIGSITTAASTAPLSVNVAGGSVTTAGSTAHAVRAYRFSQTGTGAITVGVTDGAALSTTGRGAHGVLITQNGLAGIDADLTGAVISTANTSAYGFMGWLRNNSGSPLLDIDIVRGSVKTTGPRSYGILGYVDRNASASPLSIDANGVAVSTTGERSYGVFALSLGTGRVDVELEDVAISTTGDESFGVVGNIRYAASTAAIAIGAAGDRAIAVEGLNAAGILGLQAGRGSVRVTTGAETSIEAPFAVGMEARATNDAGAAGRVVVTHEGAAEARYAGVVALAARSSGHTMGAGAQTADDAARTAPMIAVTSSGTVTVGASVMDAFVRDRIAGADETLSAAEQAVLDAVTAEDSDALDTALAALPAAYDDDWKAEARNLQRKRIAEPSAATAATRAAEEILGLSRAGVRAVALSHTGMATFIRQGDRDPAILAIPAASRTEQQQAALAEQEKLSAAERTVLEAALTGSGLETALTALTGAAYTDDWKDGVRQRAASYNAGGIRVEVTGGAITAEGNGVEALYAVPHDRNGAIAVSVSEGARVTGGANGIYVRGAGAGEGNFRAQSVTVNGAAMGGTGAGVHLAGGGRLTVGATGEVGAAMGVGVLADGAGDSSVTVAGTVTGDVRSEDGGDLSATVSGTVDGDLRAEDGGTLTLNVVEGGTVTGTVHDPAGPLTVAGRIGRLLYTNGSTVTVAATGKLTGVEVEDRTEALRSEAGDLALTVAGMGTVTGDVRALGDGDLTATVAGTLTGDVIEEGEGDLSATVSGTVDGDLRAEGGGALTLNLRQGGTVTGTVHDPVGPLTVAGRIGRLLYTSGATVTVAATGALTGVEVEGKTEALRSEAGDLDVSVAGRVTGDVRALGAGDLEATVAGTLTGDVIEEGEGDLSATVSGTVDGDLRAEGGGALTLNLMQGGTVTGTVHDPVGPLTVAGRIGRLLYTNGATVTVAATGALTGVEVEGRTEALRSEAGDLDVSVAGRVTGDVRALGAGDLDATISGTVDGDLLAQGGGALTLDLKAGGAVTGTVHDPVGPMTVAGRIGRLLYTSGGTVTVAATGRLTGIEVEGKTEAIRSEAGDLDLTVAGQVAGDLRAPRGGTLKLSVLEGGAVPGTVHDPAGPLTVAGRIGRLLYTNGATVTVAATGALTGVEVEGRTEALRSEAGDLDLTVAGTVTGDVFGLGAGEHTVTVANGGTVTGTVHLAASTVSVDGRAGRVRFDNGGTVTVGTTGWITGIEVGGRTEAIRNAAGDLVVSVAGRVAGDIIGLGARPARVTTEPGSRVAGSVEVAGAGSEVRVDGTVEGGIQFRRGGRVTVGPDGKVEGWVSRGEGELVAVIERKPEETTRAAARERAFPGGIDLPDDEILLRPELADHEPRMRVYEALPSVVLGLNGLPGFRERMAAPRSAQGGWARVETFRGKWKAEASTAGKESGVGLEHRHRRHGIQVGLAGALGEEALVGVSLHHRRGSAEVSEGGDLELSGTGVGVSGTWVREEVYVDVQAEVTGYEADLTSSRRGVLKKDVSGLGHALGVEVGRRLPLERLPAGVVLTPRAGLVHSRVSVDAFSDAVGSRVRVDGARSLKGRVGVEAEVTLGGAAGSRVFGSVEVEHEFSTGRKVRVSGRELKSEADATWLRLGLDGAHIWDDGRYTLQGGVGYATSGGSHEFGGGLSLNLRF